MKANDLLDMIGEAEDNIIAEAKKMRKVHMKRWGIVIAACFSLLIGSITTLAATGIGTRLIEFFTARDIGPDYKESGYNLSVGIEKISEADLSKSSRIPPPQHFQCRWGMNAFLCKLLDIFY